MTGLHTIPLPALYAQLIHNEQLEQVTTTEVSADELWSFVQTNRSNVIQTN